MDAGCLATDVRARPIWPFVRPRATSRSTLLLVGQRLVHLRHGQGVGAGDDAREVHGPPVARPRESAARVRWRARGRRAPGRRRRAVRTARRHHPYAARWGYPSSSQARATPRHTGTSSTPRARLLSASPSGSARSFGRARNGSSPQSVRKRARDSTSANRARASTASGACVRRLGSARSAQALAARVSSCPASGCSRAASGRSSACTCRGDHVGAVGVARPEGGFGFQLRFLSVEVVSDVAPAPRLRDVVPEKIKAGP